MPKTKKGPSQAPASTAEKPVKKRTTPNTDAAAAAKAPQEAPKTPAPVVKAPETPKEQPVTAAKAPEAPKEKPVTAPKAPEAPKEKPVTAPKAPDATEEKAAPAPKKPRAPKEKPAPVEKKPETPAEKPAAKKPKASKEAAAPAEKTPEVPEEKPVSVEKKPEPPKEKPAPKKPKAPQKAAAPVEKKPEAPKEAPEAIEEKKPEAPKEMPAPIEEKKPEAPKEEPAPVEEKKPEAPKEEPAPVEEKKPEAPKEEPAPIEEKKPETPKEEPAPVEEKKPEAPQAEPMPVEEAPVVTEEVQSVQEEAQPMAEPYYTPQPGPRRSIAFIGSECYPFVKTGGLADVMYALPKALSRMNCDVKVIIPRYACIPWEYQSKMVYRGEFYMPLCTDGRTFYVGIMEYVWDGVVYDFIDNQDFFSGGSPYTSIVGDIPKFCYFSKAALAALNYMDWIPDIIHCHDWQAALVPVYLRTLFQTTPLSRAKTVFTIHNLRFQGVYNIPTVRYWSGLPDYVFNKDALTQNWLDANMMKGGLTYCNMITTVSNTYAREIQTPAYGEKLDAHLRYHSGKLRGIVNGIDYDIWNPWTDPMLHTNYDITNVLPRKKENKRALQEELGLWQDDHKFVIGLISRLTNQKGLDLVNAILPQIMDEHTQVVVLGTGDTMYEDAFRYYEHVYKGNLCANIMYDEGRAHRIYAGCDALLVPSKFEPCGLTQLIGMHYGTIPIVRETGGLKDTVQPRNEFTNDGNGFTFDRYDAGLLLDAINRAKTFYFTNRYCWDEMVQRDMDKNVSWENSAWQYRNLYLELT